MFCKNCGQENRDDALFCRGCGTPLGNPAREPEKKKSMLPLILVLAAAAAAAVGILIWVFLADREENEKTLREEPAVSEQETEPETEPAPDILEQEEREVSMSVLSHEPVLSGCDRIGIREAEASTEYVQEKYDNSAWAAFDGNETTSWQEDAGGSGVGEWILGRFDAEYDVKYIGLKLGNWRDEERFLGNNRPTELEVSVGGCSETVCFSDEMKEQWIELSEPCPASEIRLTIRNVCRGDNREWNEGCISEIVLYAQE